MGHSATIYLVRHAKAGERRGWKGDDLDRPLSRKGWRQSNAVATRLESKGVTALYSSAYVRCMQTLEPLGEKVDLPVRAEPCLLEHEPIQPVLEFLRDVDDGAVLCSHGDIIPAVILQLERDGMRVQTPPDWGKAGVWVLRRKGNRITHGKVWPPPVLSSKKLAKSK